MQSEGAWQFFRTRRCCARSAHGSAKWALLAQARLGKRTRQRLTAEVGLRSDTADPGRADRLKTLTAALSADGP
ncbi:MAG: hypothetical protein ACREKH_21125 [Candidatus Rokuibacteriota bacterium]